MTWNYPISKYYSKKFVSELIAEWISWKNVMKNKKRIYRNVKRKTKYTWAEEDLENTMFEVLSVPGTSILGVVKKFEIKASILRF